MLVLTTCLRVVDVVMFVSLVLVGGSGGRGVFDVLRRGSGSSVVMSEAGDVRSSLEDVRGSVVDSGDVMCTVVVTTSS